MAPSTHLYVLLAVSLLGLKCTSALTTQSRQTTDCIQVSAPAFNLVARYKDTPALTSAVKVIDVNTVPKVGYSLLSICPGCTGPWSYYILDNGALLPKSSSSPYLNTVSFSRIDGESPTFISTQFPPPALKGYCFTGNPIQPTGPLVLAVNGCADMWSLCPNSTANGRVDVVWSPAANHPHYSRNACRSVYLEKV